MRVSRSLTIKQMAMVAGVSMVFVFIFCVILLFHFLQQNRYNTATQLESIARSVREPLSAAILKADIPEAAAIIKQIKPAGVVSRADVVLPNQFQALRMSFIPERPVPVMITRMFELPVQISLPIYSLERPANPQPLAYLVLQADSYRVYKFVISTLSTLVTAYLLLTLMLTVALTWCINRLVVHPLRKISRELNDLPLQELSGHQLPVPRLHHDDEIGILVRSYNRNQQQLLRLQDDLSTQATHFPVSELPNKAFLMALLEQTVSRDNPATLLVIACDTLRDTAGVLQEAQREMLLLTLVEKLKSVLPPPMVLAQVSAWEFAIIAYGINAPWHAMALGKQVLTVINERVPLHGIQLRPTASIGVAMFTDTLSAGQLYQRAISAVASAQRKGKNQIQFFDPEQMEQARQWLAQQSDLLTALDEGRFALWLQPQVDLTRDEVVSAHALLRLCQSDGSWEAEGLDERIAACGLTANVGYWALEEACRLLAGWQSRDVMLPLTVNLSAGQLLHHTMVADLLELMQRYQIAPQTLILAVSDSRTFADPEMTLVRALREAGVRVALDDFGMGYAGLGQLQQRNALPVDLLNIGKTLVASLPDDSRMLAAVIQLAHSLDLQTMAAGVENDAQRRWLAEAGVDLAQGDLFGDAVPAEEFAGRFFAAAQQPANG
ncbi:sensor domain-containing phosphodiesterase [Enterobacter sp. Bisph1]|uniref:sensor domain-containing phosphodiesterase n=1 Tax=Enterobacter sp. Bisph1 TaxID=1274399 RepID=UPI00057BDB4D|nr:sensor domain-containing phosphodiesterase [Enterobacter sp. Bisph1]